MRPCGIPWFAWIALAGAGAAAAVWLLAGGRPAADAERAPDTPRKGRPMPPSINSLECLTINGVKQWILVRSNDTTRPVLLVLHGGPGFAMLPLLHAHNAALEDHFVVVNWDQRGAGRSYSRSVPAASMTFRQLLDDLRELTRRLKARFGRDRIVLLGHSFGTMLGLSAVKEHPEDYQAYVAVGQVIGPIANEIAMYDWALRRARAAGNARAVRELTRIGRPNKDGRYAHDGPGGADPYDTAEYWTGYFGGSLYGKRGGGEIETWLLEQPVYRGRWGRKWRAGLAFSGKVLDDPAAWRLDFRTSVPEVRVPAYFLQGRHDYETPAPLVEAYAAALKAPRKELVWFEKSAHFPFYEQSAEFNRALVRVLKTSPRRK